MKDTKANGALVCPSSVQLQRLIPTQKRSRDRYERILATAAAIIAESGSDHLKMSYIVECTGIPFGSLYQYFGDKTAIVGTLAERYYLEGRACVENELAGVANLDDLNGALSRITTGYYQMYLQEPLMRDIWNATQGDRLLQKLDNEDMQILSDILMHAMLRIQPHANLEKLKLISALIMELIAAAVRHAIQLDAEKGIATIQLFTQMLVGECAQLLD